MRSCLLLPILFGLYPCQDPDAGAVRLKWKLAKYDFVRLRASNFDPRSPDKLQPNSQRAAGLFGYEIQDDTRYVAAPGDDREIPLGLIWTLPSIPLSVGQSIPLNADFDQFPYGTIAVQGITTRQKSVKIDGASCVELFQKGAFAMKKGGPTAISLKKTHYEATLDFDLALGIARKTRFSWSYTYSIALEPQKTEYTITYDEVLEYVKTVPFRGPEFEGEVNKAIDAGIEALWKKFDEKEGHWEKFGAHDVGQSALALLAILKGTLNRQDPRLRRALDWILAQPIKKVYDTGIALLALEAWYSPRDPAARFKPGETPDPDIVAKIEKPHAKWAADAVKFLETQQLLSGMWTYPVPGVNIGDFSNTQYGVLGLFAASHLGAPINAETAYKVFQSYQRTQDRTGPKVNLARTDQAAATKGRTQATEPSLARGWWYVETPGPSFGSMTLGGIASLTILDSILRRAGVAKHGKAEQAKVLADRRDGWAWMQANWRIRSNPHYGWVWYTYYLYSLERAAMLSGVATLGGHDWYWEGAEVLISNQSEDGTWVNAVYDTCFCILFLKRATYYIPTPTK